MHCNQWAQVCFSMGYRGDVALRNRVTDFLTRIHHRHSVGEKREKEPYPMKEILKGKGDPVHIRSITTKTYSLRDDTILVQGILKDNRLAETYSITTGDRMEPGVVHELTISLLIKGDLLRIDDVDVEMNHIPRQDCIEMKNALQPLKGKRIAPGFTSWVKSTLGGPKGCTHLNALLIAMAPAAVQGFWTNRVREPLNVREASKGMDAGYLIDTCWVWRSDGELAKQFRQIIQKEQ